MIIWADRNFKGRSIMWPAVLENFELIESKNGKLKEKILFKYYEENGFSDLFKFWSVKKVDLFFNKENHFLNKVH